MQGTAEHAGDDVVLRFERHFAQPIERVWAAISEPAQLTKWIAGDDAEVELRVGGRVWFAGHGGIESTVVDLDPQHLIEYGWRTSDWEGGTIRWELSENDGGTKLVFTHRFPEPDPAEQERLMKKMGFGPEMYDAVPRNLAGWHALLDALDRSLGTHVPEIEWTDIHRIYVAALSDS